MRPLGGEEGCVMATEAKKTFDRNIQRAAFFLDIHEKTQPGVGAPNLARRELPRGSIVFAVGALDAYLSEVQAEVIVIQLQETGASADSRDILKGVQQEIPTLALEVALLSSEADRLLRISDAIVHHFENNVSNFGARGVANALRRMGAKAGDFWTNLAQSGFQDAPDALDRWTNIRHEIVHQGKRPVVHRPHARDFISLAKAIVAALDAIAETGCRVTTR